MRSYESGDQLAYQYAFSDHLGNTRVLAEPAGAGIVQKTAYYPYGLQIADLGGGSSTNEELYNGKELTDSHGLNWYHYGARFYDVEIARWTTMDPADQFHSPYVYVGGDPVNLIDPDGRQATSCGDGPLNCNNAPVIDVTIEDEPKNMDIDFDQYSSQLRSRLVANGYSSYLKIQRGYPSPFQSLKRWWNDTPSASIDVRDYNVLQDREKEFDEKLGGYSRRGSEEAVVLTGNNTYNASGNNPKPLWWYVNVTMHELGHASFEFDDYRGSSNPTSIMNYREASLNPNASFSKQEQNVIKNSKWGSSNDHP